MHFKKRQPKLWEALVPIVFLTLLLSLSVKVYKDHSLEGSNQIVLILSASVAAVIAIFTGTKWDEML
ncbi:MAG: sodium:proton antiporter, partial [Bacteroidales bacterium]|nr:sodium:proton antiporter [Bacteroidales bacterium]